MKKLPKWLKVMLVIGLLGALAGGMVFYFLTYRPESSFTKAVIIPVVKPVVDKISGLKKHKAVEGSQPDFTLSANDLYNAFSASGPDASADFTGKIIQLTGTVANVAGGDEQRVILLTIENDPASNVSCQMDPQYNDRLQNISAGDAVTIKGICTGAREDELFGSLDIFLNRAVVIK